MSHVAHGFKRMVKAMNEELMKKAGFTRQVDLVKEQKCPFCGKDVNPNDFKDELSRKEYMISGICQTCQDEFFDTKFNI